VIAWLPDIVTTNHSASAPCRTPDRRPGYQAARVAQKFTGKLTDVRVWTGAHEKTRAIKNAGCDWSYPTNVLS
jgi:hypothetical protein